MKLIVGLGNPGKEYENTPHNAGFMYVDYLAKKWNAPEFQMKKKFVAEITDVIIDGEKYILAKPHTYMNDSGRAVYEIMNFYSLELNDLIVAHDDLDIELGKYKIQVGKGPKEHNGISSIENALKDNDFERIRIGIESRDNRDISGRDYVLNKWTKDKLEKFSSVIQEITLHYADSNI